MVVQDGLIKVRASVRLLSTEEGGRTDPIRGGYRPNHNFFGPDSREMTIGLVDLPDGVELRPGETMELTIAFWAWPGLVGQIYSGRRWSIQEGARLVGVGTIKEVLE